MGPAFTANIDLAQVVLYVFWAFFAGLIYYLHRENKREGYPLLSDRTNERVSIIGFPAPPAPKTYLLPHGGTVTVPNGKADDREIKARPVALWPGAPLEPTGNPMVDGVGPAAWAERSDHPDLTFEGAPKIVPLRVAGDFYLEARDPDPRGMSVVGTDRVVGGTIVDVWVDRSEYLARYFEVDVAGAGRRVLVPVNFCRIDGARRTVKVNAILGSQFAAVPATKHPDQVTFLEEDKIMGYYGGGYLYATPARAEPLL
jgi:photosynthetic reaction center H subunit